MAFAATVRKPRGNSSRQALVPHQSPNSGAFRIGQKVTVVRNMGKLENATIRFIGETKFYSGVTWYGVELQEATGKNNGSVHGERYFRCAMNHGLFVRREMISHTGWGRQTTSRSPFKGDDRTLLSGDVDDYGSERGMWAVDDGEAATLSSKATTSSRVRSLFDNKKEETRKRIQDRSKRQVAYYTTVPADVAAKGLFKGLDSDQGAHKDALIQFQKPATRAWYHETDPSLIGIGQQLEQLDRIRQSLIRPNLPRKEKLKAISDWSARAADLQSQTHERLRQITELLDRIPEVLGGSVSYVPPTIMKTATKVRRRRRPVSSDDEDEPQSKAQPSGESSSEEDNDHTGDEEASSDNEQESSGGAASSN